MDHYSLDPEVAGGWGEGTVADTSVHPPVVRHLHYRFDGWLGDDLLASFPCFIVTAPLASRLRQSRLSGFQLRPVTITRSELFEQLYPGKALPSFEWLQIRGAPGVDDFGFSLESMLIVSSSAKDLLNEFSLRHCKILEWSA